MKIKIQWYYNEFLKRIISEIHIKHIQDYNGLLYSESEHSRDFADDWTTYCFNFYQLNQLTKMGMTKSSLLVAK